MDPTIIKNKTPPKIDSTTEMIDSFNKNIGLSARRCLFDRPDPNEIERFCDGELAKQRMRVIRDYGFDTETEQMVDRYDITSYENAFNLLLNNIDSGLINKTRQKNIHERFGLKYFEGNQCDLKLIDDIVNEDELLLARQRDMFITNDGGLDNDDNENSIDINNSLNLHYSNKNNIKNELTMTRKACRMDKRAFLRSPYSKNSCVDTNIDKTQHEIFPPPPPKKSKEDK